MHRSATGQIRQCLRTCTAQRVAAGCSDGRWAPLTQARPRRAVRCAVHQRQAGDSADPNQSSPVFKGERLPVLSLIAASVESTVRISQFLARAGHTQ